MDGTLIDSAADIGAAVNRMRVSFGLKELARESVVRMVGSGARVLVARALADTPGADPDEAYRRYRHEYDTHLIDETRLYSGVQDALKTLKSAGFRLAVFTNKPYSSTRFILKGLGIDPFFSAVCQIDYRLYLRNALVIIKSGHKGDRIGRIVGKGKLSDASGGILDAVYYFCMRIAANIKRQQHRHGTSVMHRLLLCFKLSAICFSSPV